MNLNASCFSQALQKYILTEKQLGKHGFPLPHPHLQDEAIVKSYDQRMKISPSETQRYCRKCSALYQVDGQGFALSPSTCVHHWGKIHGSYYSCCKRNLNSVGCTTYHTHVSENFRPNKLTGFVKTTSTRGNPDEVYALDCEMCYTTVGNELCRVTIVDSNKKIVYESFVKPDNPIIDYNTKFSGISEDHLRNETTNIHQVQEKLLHLISDKTILIGHSLENDLLTLKIIHKTVVDTSVVYPHRSALPLKRSLKNLAMDHLYKNIQTGVKGHDSSEDAITCMELMEKKVRR